MDTYLAVASKRDERRYDARPVPDDVLTRVLDAGRLAGSSKNKQPWRFVVVVSSESRERVAEAVWAPDNVCTAAVAIALVTTAEGAFDFGRAAQNMMLTAWNDGVASCPNGIRDQDVARRVLSLAEDERVVTILSLGYPARPRDVEARPADEWSARANRKPLGELVTRI